MAGAKRDLSEIDAELRWVEDNIPAAPGASFLPTDDVGFTGGEDDAMLRRRRSDSKKFTAKELGWFASQPGWVQCLVAFVVFFIFLNIMMWLSGTSEDQDISTERGYSRVVPGKLTNDDD